MENVRLRCKSSLLGWLYIENEYMAIQKVIPSDKNSPQRATGSYCILSVSFLQLRQNLRMSQGDTMLGIEEANQAMMAAQQEAASQEEIAELARGELDEYKRRMAAEIENARHQARLDTPSRHQGGPPKVLTLYSCVLKHSVCLQILHSTVPSVCKLSHFLNESWSTCFWGPVSTTCVSDSAHFDKLLQITNDYWIKSSETNVTYKVV